MFAEVFNIKTLFLERRNPQVKLSSILLSIISRMDGERTIYAGLHLLRGKRSGQTLQDVEYYNLKSFFGVWPKLNIEVYDEAAEELYKVWLFTNYR